MGAEAGVGEIPEPLFAGNLRRPGRDALEIN